MLHEYAIEPRCFSNWKDFRYMVMQLGISQGRVVSDYPKDWLSKVVAVCSGFSFEQKKRMEVDLLRLKRTAMVPSCRTFNTTKEWMENALEEQKNGKPFHAIIANYKGDNAPPYVFEVDDLVHEEPLWNVGREKKALRTVEELGRAVSYLLRISNRIVFVDKMFVDQLQIPEHRDRWLNTLGYFFKIATTDRAALPIFEYHSEGRIITSAEEADLVKKCNESLESLIPTGSSLKIVRWTEKASGKDFFHSRYILTERGGIRIDWGLDEGKGGEKTEQRTDITLLDDGMWQSTWSQFQAASDTFLRITPDIVVAGPL